MSKYILFKYDDERFASGDVIRNYPVKRVELTENEIGNISIGKQTLGTCKKFLEIYPNSDDTNVINDGYQGSEK